MESILEVGKIDGESIFFGVARLQYEASTLRKNDSEIRVSIKPDFQEKILDFGLDLRKKVSGKSTWNRFWK